MKRIALALVLAATATFAAPKHYQVTGKVVEIGSDVIVIQKGNEKWEMAKEASLGDVRLGQKVTLFYAMAAKSMAVAPETVAPAAAAPHRATSTKAR
ncbi:MAG TPA: hypothetical protein PKO15_12140 [Fibrobacteria bacterium]|nr:hypothetical protein [Fibrobacteria bacterium]HOX51344.1 hypothetical protein [Fibrobacteria bacterium]